MTRVNLLAAAADLTARARVARGRQATVIGFVIVFVVVLGAGGWWWMLHQRRSGIESKIAAAEIQLAKLSQTVKLVDQATARRAELSERVTEIGRLRAASAASARLLQAVSNSVPDGLWLIELRQASGRVQIEGRAMSLASVTDFAERLEQSGSFARPVDILSTSRDVFEEVSLVRFSLRAE